MTEVNSHKPRLVFFQWRHDGLPMFLQMHMRLHVKCLSEFFDVVLINKNCDYRQICDQYQPDLALFESGFRTKVSQKLDIKNTAAYSEIPKLGLHNGDSWCDCRGGFISDMAQWGIETFFSISTTMAEHTPEIAENLFVWPNFIDSDVYHDYGEDKNISVLFSGFMNPLYPWRQNICKTISTRYSPFTLAHSGYSTNMSTMVAGEQYARRINASWFVPACGTIAKEVVRKHFEIPGSKACLLTEKTPALEAAGFADMQNCVFADVNDVLDKMEYLFENKNELAQIIANGYQLVQSHHTLKQRDQIYQWFIFRKKLKPDERIVQGNPFQPLQIEKLSPGIKTEHIVCNGKHLELLRRGDEKLWEGDYDSAEALYLECLDYINWMREPKIKLAICSLFKGDANAAFRWIIEPLTNQFRVYKATEPDPVEWSYFIISLLCSGRLEEAILRGNQFPLLHHPELERVRWTMRYLRNSKHVTGARYSHLAKPRYSIHQLPQRSLEEWVRYVCNLLTACQQYRFAAVLRGVINAKEEGSLKNIRSNPLHWLKKHFIRLRISCSEKFSRTFKILYVPNPKRGLPPVSVIEYFIQSSGRTKIDLVKRVYQNYLSPRRIVQKLFLLIDERRFSFVTRFMYRGIKK